jgi:hypothetical protein
LFELFFPLSQSQLFQASRSILLEKKKEPKQKKLLPAAKGPEEDKGSPSQKLMSKSTAARS